MKLMINIPDEAYELLKSKSELDNIAESIIANGTPVSNEGDLISREWLKDAFDNLCCHNCKICRNFRNEDSFYKCNLIENAPTISPEKALMDKLKGDEERPQGEWIDYDNTFYKCPDCGYLLEKCCPQCQNKVILPKGGAE